MQRVWREGNSAWYLKLRFLSKLFLCCLFRSVSPCWQQTQPHCVTKSSSSSEDFHQHKVQILATGSSCHEQNTDCVLPYCLEILQLLLFFQWRQLNFPKFNLTVVHSLIEEFLYEYVNFLLLFNPVAERETLQKSAFWMKSQMFLDTNQTSSFLNSSCCWHLTPTISKLL